jgi:hypothetical protein
MNNKEGRVSLLREIQEAAIDAGIDISVLLRKCKVLAARLGNQDFKLWVDYELNGYPSKDELPEYRILHVESYGNFLGIGWSQYKHAPIPPSCIPEDLREFVSTQYLTDPISHFASLVSSKTGAETISLSWPADMVALVGDKIYEGMQCMLAWKIVSIGSIVALLDTVRNRILSFVLEIETEAPDAGEAQPKNIPIAEERVRQVFQTYIMGDVGHLNAGGNQNITYDTKVTVVQNDLASLRQFLTSLGIADKDLDDLEDSILQDAKSKTQQRLGDRVRSWLGKIITKAGTSAWNIATSVAANLITQALSKYYGFQI